MEDHSTKAIAARAVDLCTVLLYEDATAESVARVLRAHGERGGRSTSPGPTCGRCGRRPGGSSRS
ncbi:hypothetical protein ACFSTC_18510 [Nonomuraea ferruginea]